MREAWLLRTEAAGAPANERAARICVACGLEAVMIEIARNAGISPYLACQQLKVTKAAGVGFDARTGKVGDILGAGIVDSISLTSGTLSRAISLAATMLRVEAIDLPIIRSLRADFVDI